MAALSMSRSGFLLLALLACTSPISVELQPGALEHPLRTVALAPFSVGIPLARVEPAGTSAEGVAKLVRGRVLEALTRWTDLRVVPPQDVTRVLATNGPLAVPSTPAEIGRELKRAFGVDAVLYGTVYRFVPRVGGTRGAVKPAAVWFKLELKTPAGDLLWSGTYDEIQRSLSEDLGSFQRTSERGFRWLSAEQLVEYGAVQLVRRIPHAGASWK